MSVPRSPWFMVCGGVLTFGGLAVVLYALRGTDSSVGGLGDSLLTRTLMVMFGGAVLFAVGLMIVLASVVRPLFERRPVDDLVDRLK